MQKNVANNLHHKYHKAHLPKIYISL